MLEQFLVDIFGPHLAQAVIVLMLIGTSMYIASRLVLNYYATVQRWRIDGD